jgi:hypothetical protein
VITKVEADAEVSKPKMRRRGKRGDAVVEAKGGGGAQLLQPQQVRIKQEPDQARAGDPIPTQVTSQPQAHEREAPRPSSARGSRAGVACGSSAAEAAAAAAAARAGAPAEARARAAPAPADSPHKARKTGACPSAAQARRSTDDLLAESAD